MLFVSVKTFMTSPPNRNSINYELNVISNIEKFAKEKVKSNRIIQAHTLHYFMSHYNYKCYMVQELLISLSQKD